jgi:anti-sigma factor RsiW
MRSHPSDLLSGYVDGTLSRAEHVGIEEHLATCIECRKTVDEVRTLQILLRAAPQPTVPPAALSRTLALLEARRSEHRWGVPRWSVAAAAGVAALIVALQWPIDPSPGPDSAKHAGFQSHAEVSLAHPLADMALVTYLATHLPYDFELTSVEPR